MRIYVSLIIAALNREVIRFESPEIAVRDAAILAGVRSGLFQGSERLYP